MYFRNTTLFQVPRPFLNQLPALHEALGQHPLRACGPLEVATRGFVSPYGDGFGDMECVAGSASLFALGVQEKILPASAVATMVNERVRKMSAERGRPIGGRARRQIKSEVLDELLPRALVKQTRTEAYTDTAKGLVVIDAASRKTSETVITALREAFGSFPAVPLAPTEPPRVLMTAWLSGQAPLPAGLELGSECELRDPAGGSTARCGKQELEAREVQEHIKAGKQVYKLGLVFNEHVSFVLREDMTLSKLALLDGAIESLDDSEKDGPEAEIAARFALMSGEFSELFEALFDWFGIEAPDAE